MSNSEEKPGRAGASFVLWGSIFIVASVVAFTYGLFWLNLTYIPTHRDASEDLPAILVLSNPICIEFIGFVVGIIFVTIGLSKRRSYEP